MPRSRRIRLGAPLAAAGLAITLFAGACSKPADQANNNSEGTAPNAQVKLTKDKDAGDAQSGGSMVFGLNAETDGWSPFFNRYAGSGYIVGNAIYDPLFAYDENGDPQPFLAESATADPASQFKEWTIKLRAGISFHNGEKLDALAVKKNFQSGLSSGLVGAALEPIASVDGEAGSLEVKVHMKRPWSTFTQTLTSQLGYVQAPSLVGKGLSDMTEDEKAAATRKPIGTGPFIFEDWQPDKSLKVKKNPNYWRKDAKGNKLPYLDNIEFRVIADFQSRGQSMESGTLDAMEIGDQTQLAKFREKAQANEYQMYTDEGLDTQEIFVALNTAKPPFDDPIARQILAYGIDTDQLSKDSFNGEFPAASGPFTKESPFYTETDYPKYDVDKAKALHEEYKKKHNGQALEFSAIVPPIPEYQAIAQSLKAQAEAYGVKVAIDSKDQTALIVAVLTGNYQASGFILFGSPSIDREYVFIASEPKPVGETSLNFTRLKNPALTKAMDDARATDDRAKQIEAFKTVQKELAKDLGIIFLVHSRSAIVYRNQVHGFTSATSPDGKTLMTSVTPFTAQVWVKR